MARTIPQIENDIDNKVLIHIMEYVKDYMAHKLNVEFGNLNTSLNNIKQKILGTSQVTAQLGQPQAPSTTPPASPVEGDWYFNTVDKKFYMYHTGSWQEIADLSHIVDTTPIQTETKKYASWAELEADKDRITNVTAWAKARFVWGGVGMKQEAPILLHPFFTQGWGTQGVLNLENNAEYKAIGDSNGLQLRNGTTIVSNNGVNYIGWDKFDLFATVIKGKAIVTTTGGTANINYGTLEELYKVENGQPVDKFSEKVLHLGEIAELVKDQREIDKGFLASFTDDISYADATHVQYRDKGLNLVTLNAEVSKAGNTLSYTTLISPYDRIAQEQAQFTGKFKKNGTAVEYIFTGKGKAIKFFGNVGDSYRWETIAKFEGNTRVPYIRFSGSAVMDMTDNALSPAPTWNRQTLPLEVKLSDLMDENNRTALVQMQFQTEPQIGDKLLEIDYLTSTYFIEQRLGKLLTTIGKDNDARYEFKTFDFTKVARPLSELTQSGNRYIIIDMPNGADATPIGANNEILLGAAPAGVQDADQVTYGTELIWIVKANGDIMNWSEIKDNVAAHQVMVIRHLSNGNWELVGWKSAFNKSYVDDEVKKLNDAIALKTDDATYQTDKAAIEKSITDGLAAKLDLDLGNVSSDAEKTAFINGLKAIGVDTSLFGEFLGVLTAAPSSPENLHWYINSTTDSIFVYHNGTWHEIGKASAPAATLTKQQILNLLTVTEAQINELKTLQTKLDEKLNLSDYRTAFGQLQNAINAKADQTALDAKQDTLTKTLRVEFTDGSHEDFKVG